MIAQLKGIVDQIGEGFALIDVHGVGYRVFSSSKTLGKLVLNHAVVLQIETHVREDHLHLYGFIDHLEREWFGLLTTVQGVGTKAAMAILSIATPDELLHGLATQDHTIFTRATGVGPKLATRLLTELKGKASSMSLSSPSASATDGVKNTPPTSGDTIQTDNILENAVSALINLGYRRLEAFDACGLVLRELKAAGANSTPDQGTLIRLSLRQLGKDIRR